MQQQTDSIIRQFSGAIVMVTGLLVPCGEPPVAEAGQPQDENASAVYSSGRGWPYPADTPVDEPARFQGAPLPYTRTFLITESSWKTRVAGSHADPYQSDWVLTGDVGFMSNVSSRWAVGATVQLALDDNGARWSVRPRVRYWTTRYLSIDLSPGLVFAGTDNTGQRDIGVNASVTVGYADWIAWSTQLEILPYTITTVSGYPYTEETHSTNEVMLYTGVTLQSYAGIAGALAAGAAVLIAFASWSGSI